MNDDFRDLLEALLANGARFLVVGAHAMAVHGVVRSTGDLDLWVDTEPQNVARVWLALEQFGAPLEALGFSIDDLSEGDMVWQLGVPPRRVDILASIDGIEFEQAWAEHQQVDWEGVRVPVASLDTLRTNKAATGREKDRLDLDLLGHPQD